MIILLYKRGALLWESSMIDEIKEIITMVNTGDKVVWYIISILFFSLIYREVKSNYIKEIDEKRSVVEKTLEKYGQIEISLIRYLETKDETKFIEVMSAMSSSYPYTSHELLKQWHQIKSDISNNNEIIKFQTALQAEISLLNFELNKDRNSFITGFTKILISIIAPLLITISIVILATLAILIIYALSIDQKPVHDKVFLIAQIVSVITFSFFFHFLIIKVIDKKLTLNFLGWLLVIITTTCFVLSIKYSFLSFLNLALLILFMCFLSKLRRSK